MWRTPNGERVLTGPESALFRAGLGSLVEQVDVLDHDWDLGVRLFDALSHPQKLALLAEVGSALLDPGVTPPPLTAIREAALAAVYAHIRSEMHVEIDLGQNEFRKLVLACLEHEEPLEPHDPLRDPPCDDPHEWDAALDCLTDNLLWDDDFDMESVFVDAPPEASDRLKGQMGISSDYYTGIPPDPTDKELPSIRRRLEELVNEKENG